MARVNSAHAAITGFVAAIVGEMTLARKLDQQPLGGAVALAVFRDERQHVAQQHPFFYDTIVVSPGYVALHMFEDQGRLDVPSVGPAR
jgi:hypothetical protein